MRAAALVTLALALASAAPAALPAPSATLAFARSEAAGGGIYLVAHGRPRLVVPAGAEPAWSPDSRRLAYVAPSADGAGEVYTADADGRRRGQITSTTAAESHPDWSADGRRIVVERDGRIVIVRADGGRERALAPGHEPDWSPNGRLIAFASGGDLFTVEPARGRIARRDDLDRPGRWRPGEAARSPRTRRRSPAATNPPSSGRAAAGP